VRAGHKVGLERSVIEPDVDAEFGLVALDRHALEHQHRVLGGEFARALHREGEHAVGGEDGGGETFAGGYGQDKVIWGTDYPLLPFDRTVDDVYDCDFSDEATAKVLRGNALRVFGIDR